MSEPQTKFLVGKRDEGKRLDQFLHERIPGLSRTRIQQAVRERVEQVGFHAAWLIPPRG